MGIYTPRVVVGTIFGGYFELDTKGKQFVVLKDHPEVSAAGVVKASSRLIVTFALLVIFFLVL